jgi:PAS domain-containing protein
VFGRIKVVYRMAIVVFCISVVPLMGAGGFCLAQGYEGLSSLRNGGLIIIAAALFWGIAATFALDILFGKYLLWLETSIKNIKANLDRTISQDPVEEKIFLAVKSWVVDLCVITELGHSIFESIESGIITLDKDGIITYINNVGEELLGADKKLAVGKSYRELQTGSLVLCNQLSVLSFLEDAIDRGICYDNIELDGLYYGEKCTLNITTKILKDYSGLR